MRANMVVASPSWPSSRGPAFLARRYYRGRGSRSAWTPGERDVATRTASAAAPRPPRASSRSGPSPARPSLLPEGEERGKVRDGGVLSVALPGKAVCRIFHDGAHPGCVDGGHTHPRFGRGEASCRAFLRV